MCARAIFTAFSIASAPVVKSTALRRLADERAQPRRQLDVRLVHRHLKTGVHQAIELFADGADHERMAMAGVEHADAAREVEVFLAVDVPDARAFGAGDEDGMRVGQAARHELLARGDRRVRLLRSSSSSFCLRPHRAATVPRRASARSVRRRSRRAPSSGRRARPASDRRRPSDSPARPRPAYADPAPRRSSPAGSCRTHSVCSGTGASTRQPGAARRSRRASARWPDRGAAAPAGRTRLARGSGTTVSARGTGGPAGCPSRAGS